MGTTSPGLISRRRGCEPSSSTPIVGIYRFEPGRRELVTNHVTQALTAVLSGRRRTFLKSRQMSAVFLALTVVFIFLAIVWFGASGVRGTDQYWYVTDVESLIDGRGVQTNEIYPVSVRHDVVTSPRPFVHNRLNLYIVALPALLLGAYNAWIVVNVVSSLLTSVLLFYTVIRVTRSDTIALTTAVTYLLLPLTLWLTTQPLVEASTAPLVALAVYLYVTANAAFWRWALLMLIAALLAYCHEDLVLPLPLIPFAYLLHVRPLHYRGLMGAAGLLALGGGLWLLGRSMFEPYLSVTYWHVLTSPGPEDMNWFFDLNPQPLSISAILAKAVKGLEAQLTRIDTGYLLFYLPFNIMAVAPLVLLLRGGRGEVARVGVAGLVVLALHLTTAIVVQNQFRYLLIATPPMLVAVGVLVARTDWFLTLRLTRAVYLAAMLILAPPCVALAWHSHDEGILERDASDNLAIAFKETVPANDTVMAAVDLQSGFKYQRLGYVLRPRRAIFVSDRYSAADYAALVKNANAKWLMSRRDSPILKLLGPATVREVRALPVPFADWSLFAIQGGTPAP
jgi:hypothetical protein